MHLVNTGGTFKHCITRSLDRQIYTGLFWSGHVFYKCNDWA